MTQSNIELLRRAWSAYNRGDEVRVLSGQARLARIRLSTVGRVPSVPTISSERRPERLRGMTLRQQSRHL